MQSFIDHLTARNYQGRTVGMIENGAWAPMAAKVLGVCAQVLQSE